MADIPPDPPDNEKAFFVQYLDAALNSGILYALLHGIYTGILVVTLWNIFINKCWPIRRALVVVIILLYVLITINFAGNWSYIHSAFIDNGQNIWTVYLKLVGMTHAAFWVSLITTVIGTILADLYIIWCCWMVWGRRWPVVLLPILSLVFAIVSRIMEIYFEYVNASTELFLTLYISLILATTLWCTLLIIYRIWTIAGVRYGAGGRLRVYHRFIEVLVESSALYSVTLILYLAFTLRRNLGLLYLDVVTVIAKGIAPTLLIGRFTAGRRARPDDSWQGSVMASVSIRSQSQEHSLMSSQENILMSLVPDGDLEAQRESDVREASPTFLPGPDVPEAAEYVRSITGQHGDLV